MHTESGASSSSSSSLLEYCQWETFNATCQRGSVVVMHAARYGRMKHGRCADTDVYIGCSADVLAAMDARCSGRQACAVPIPDSHLHQQQPCPNDMMAYLEASFSCVRGTLAIGICCRGQEPTLNVFLYMHTHTRLTALCPGLPG